MDETILNNFKEVHIMDIKRAKEIASSSVMANVSFNGQKIYIENVDDSKGTAFIHPLNKPNNRQEVEIASLVEFQ